MVFGIILGIFLAFSLAFAITMMWVKNSNDLGDSKGTYQQFTGAKMEFLSKKR